MQSRYYDLAIGRFINADGYIATGQGLLGYNMYAYCGNNPVLRIDATGNRWEWFKELANDAISLLEELKKQAQDYVDITASVCGTFNAAFGLGIGISAGPTFDTKGNVGLIVTVNGGGGFPNLAVGGSVSGNNAPSIYHQRGWGGVVGGSGGSGIGGGADYNMIVDQSNDSLYHGGTLAAAYGIYPTVVELHGEVGYTWVLWGLNIYDAAMEAIAFLIGK